MKALICGICLDIRALDPRGEWVSCRCTNMSARWVDANKGTVVVRAKNKGMARMMGLNNNFLEPAIEMGASHIDCQGSCEFWKNLHAGATKAPGYLFDDKWRGCWAIVYSVGETGDTKWDPETEETMPPPPEPTERTPAPPTDPSTHKLATVRGEPPAPGFETAAAPQPKDPETKQNKDHWVLPQEERAKGHIRPVRRGTLHIKCNTVTYMPLACAETYAKDPRFYGSTFCCACKDYFPVGPDGEFLWEGTDEKVGS